MTPAVYSLSIHAEYRCRHSGACCTAGWSSPVDASIRWLVDAEVIAPDASGACRFYDRPTGLCRIHRDHGEAQLPASCHHFPRVALIDDRGIFISLSHFCPTAANLLFASEPLTIVENPPAFPAVRGYEGLDARGEWPPLVRADLLFDRESYSRWEHFVVRTLDRSSALENALATIADTAERLREWQPGTGPFPAFASAILDAADREHADAERLDALDRYAQYRSADAHERVRQLVPVALGPDRLPAGVDEAFARWAASSWPRQPAIRRYLAAKSFASWTAYQSRGVRALVAEVVLSESIVRMEAARVCAQTSRPLDRSGLTEAIRAADYLLVHLARRDGLTAWFSETERAPADC